MSLPGLFRTDYNGTAGARRASGRHPVAAELVQRRKLAESTAYRQAETVAG